MYEFTKGGLRPTVTGDRLAAAQDLVRRTLAQHGLCADGIGNGIRAASFGVPGDTLDRDAPVAGAAQFLTAVHAGHSGSRTYRTYVPKGAETGASGVIMMLHGCTQTPEDFAVGTGMNDLADREGFIVVYPGQSRGANAQTCWNWFSPVDQKRDRGEPEILAGIARIEMARYGVPAERSFVAGLSAGGAMAVILGATYPDVFAAVGAHSGLPYRAARDVASAFSAMAGQTTQTAAAPASTAPRTIVFHGTADSTVHPANGAAIARDAEQLGPRQSLQTTRKGKSGGRRHSVAITSAQDGGDHVEHWTIDGLGHAWSGGRPGGSYTDPKGPDASAEMVRFFFERDA